MKKAFFVADSFVENVKPMSKNTAASAYYIAVNVKTLKKTESSPVVLQILLLHTQETGCWQLPYVSAKTSSSLKAALKQDVYDHTGLMPLKIKALLTVKEPDVNDKAFVFMVLLDEEALADVQGAYQWFSIFIVKGNFLCTSSFHENIIHYKKNKGWQRVSHETLVNHHFVIICAALNRFRECTVFSDDFFYLLKEPFTLTMAVKVHDFVTGRPISRRVFLSKYLSRLALIRQDTDGRGTKYYQYLKEISESEESIC